MLQPRQNWIRPSSHWPLTLIGGVAALAGMALPIVLVRLLSPEEVGNFKIFFLYLGLMPSALLSSGFVNGIAFWVGKGPEYRDRVSASVVALFLLAFVFTVVGYLFAGFIAAGLSLPVIAVQLFILSIPAAMAGSVFEEIAVCRGFTWMGSLFQGCFAFVRLFVLVWVAVQYRTLESVIYAHVVMGFVRLSASLLLIPHLGFSWRMPTAGAMQEVLRYSIPVSVSSMLALFASRADQYLLATHIPATDFALYSLGCLVVPPLLVLEHSVTRLSVSRLADAFAYRSAQEAKREYLNMARTLSRYMVPAALFLLCFSESVITLLFTDAYREAALYLRVFSLWYLTLIFPYDIAARAQGNSSWILRTEILSTACALIAFFSLVPWLGAFGALASLFVVRGVMLVRASHYWRSRSAPIGVSEIGFVVRDAAVAAGAACIALLVTEGVHTPAATVVIAGLVFACIHLIVWAVWRQSPRGTAVLQITQQFGIGGLERTVLELSSALLACGHQVRIACYDAHDPALLEELRQRKIPYTAIQKGPGFSVAVVRALLRLVHEHGVGVLHTHDLGALMYGTFCKLLSPTRLRLVHTQHSFIHLSKKRRYRYYEWAFTMFADEVVAVSPAIRSSYQNYGVRKRHLHTIRNGIVADRAGTPSFFLTLQARRQLLSSLRTGPLKDALTERIDTFWILALSRLARSKGSLFLPHIWQALPDEIQRQSCLLIVGPESEPGFEASIRARIRTVAHAENILVCGPAPYPALWHDASNVFVSASEYEGHPLAPLEALASAKDVVLSDIPGHHGLDSGLKYFKRNDANAAAGLIAEIFAHSGDSTRIEQRLARSERIKSEASVATMAKHYQGLYFCADSRMMRNPVNSGVEHP